MSAVLATDNDLTPLVRELRADPRTYDPTPEWPMSRLWRIYRDEYGVEYQNFVALVLRLRGSIS